MKEGSRGTWIAALLLGAGLALGLIAQASAQYPPPVGSVVAGVSDSTPDLGDAVEVTATVLDASGHPLADVECTFRIAEQPGSDASVDGGPFTTDSEGNVSTTLDTGSSDGTIAVEASCGELTALVSVAAGASVPPPAAEPPASLPDTGSGGGGNGVPWHYWLIAAAVVGLGSLAIAWRVARA